jgi:hypothetical protein
LPDVEQRIRDTVAAYTEALERVLGTPAGSLVLMDPELLTEWLPAKVFEMQPNGLVTEQPVSV